MFTITLSDEVFSRYRPARVFLASSNSSDSSAILAPVTSVDIEPMDGDFALMAHGRHNSLTLFNARLGVSIQKSSHVACESGVALARFTRRNLESTALIAPRSTTVRTFPGHIQQVCCLEQSPVGDMFASSDSGGEMRIWDAKQSVSCIARLKIPDGGEQGASTETYLTHHPNQNALFCANGSSGKMKIYAFDVRNLSKGPTKILDVPHEAKTLTLGRQAAIANCVDLKCSPDGSTLFVTTDQDSVCCFDANDGKLVFENECMSNKTSAAVASYSADGRFIAVQGSSGVLIFGAKDGSYVTVLDGGSACGVARICCFSPRTELLISSGDDATVFWSEATSASV